MYIGTACYRLAMYIFCCFHCIGRQGLPVGFMTHALPVILRAQGVSLAQIGGFGLLMLPWSDQSVLGTCTGSFWDHPFRPLSELDYSIAVSYGAGADRTIFPPD